MSVSLQGLHIAPTPSKDDVDDYDWEEESDDVLMDSDDQGLDKEDNKASKIGSHSSSIKWQFDYENLPLILSPRSSSYTFYSLRNTFSKIKAHKIPFHNSLQ